MATLQTGSTTNYRGMLYNWSSDTAGATAYTWSASSTSYREPATLSSYDTDSQTYLSEIGLTASEFASEIQSNYNDMVTQVNKYGGFWIGRYETSYDSKEGKVASIAGGTSSTARNTNTYRGYGLY